MPAVDVLATALVVPGMAAWSGWLVLSLLGLLALCVLITPFAVAALKGRMEMLEAQLDEVQGQVRALGMRLPDPTPTEEPVLRRPATPDNTKPKRPEPKLDWPGPGPAPGPARR